MRIRSSSERSERRSGGCCVRTLLGTGRAICSPALERRRFVGMVLERQAGCCLDVDPGDILSRNQHVMDSPESLGIAIPTSLIKTRKLTRQRNDIHNSPPIGLSTPWLTCQIVRWASASRSQLEKPPSKTSSPSRPNGFLSTRTS